LSIASLDSSHQFEHETMSLFQRIIDIFRPRSTALPNDPQSIAALKLIELGQAAEKAGQLDEARRYYEQAVATAPKLAKAHMNLGNAHLAAQAVDKALDAYRTAIKLDPESAPAHYNLGNAYWHLNQAESALASYLAATDLDPKFAMPWIAIGNTLSGLDRHDDAIDACNQALKIEPRNVEAHVTLSLALKNAGRVDDCISEMRTAVAIRPDHPIALTNLANYLESAFQFKEAQVCYRRAVEISPDAGHLDTAFLYLLSQDGAIDSETLFREHLAVGQKFDRQGPAHRQAHTNTRDPDRIIRIGIVSADLRNHAVAHFIEPIVRHIGIYKEIEILAYHNYKAEDEGSNTLRQYFKKWLMVVDLHDDALEAQIRADSIDILIDLSGHTFGNRLSVFARKPAPIQASWIGYPGTTGMQTMDYYIADPKFLPPDVFARQFVEKLVYLPSTAPYVPFSIAPPIEALPALTQRHFTFGSFNRPNKIHRNVISLWARVLRGAPESHLLLAGISDQYQIDLLTRWFAEEEIADDRIRFHLRSIVEPYLRLHHEVDLCLDTFPYTGGTTTRHAFWMGVPTLTIAGTTPASRQASSIMELMQLQEFVAHSEDNFVKLAVEWSQRLNDLAQIRATMRDRYQSSPLGKPELITSAFAQATRIMWQHWCANEPPQMIDVSAIAP